MAALLIFSWTGLSASATTDEQDSPPPEGRVVIHATFDEAAYTGPVIFGNPQPGGLPITDPTTRLSYIPEGSSVTMVDRFVAESGVSFGKGHSLMISKDAESEHSVYVPFHLHQSDVITSGKLTIGFDFFIDDRSDISPAGNLFIITRNRASEPVSSLLLQPNGSLSLVRGEEKSPLGTLPRTQSHHIRLVFDLNSGTVNAYLNGADTGASLSLDLADLSQTGISGLDISVLGAGKGRWLIDNLIATVTEE